MRADRRTGAGEVNLDIIATLPFGKKKSGQCCGVV
jgi:hypothetical protein